MLNDIDTLPNYTPLTIRGSGAFGYVLEAYDKDKDCRVAIKRTHKVGKKLSREYQVLSEIRDCDDVVKMDKVFYSINDKGQIIQNTVFEYVSESLEGYISKMITAKELIPASKIKFFMRQILEGLETIHSKSIVHRDLKPENILLQDDKVKICDFGSSKFITSGVKSTPYIVSRYYRAPELLLARNDYDSKIDIFAVGCIMAELFTLNALFPGKSEGLQIFEIIMVMGKPNNKFWNKFNVPEHIKESFISLEDFKPQDLKSILNKYNEYDKEFVKQASDLLGHLIQMDPENRYTASKALQHKFFL
jgi:glycogen synthase kinase 3 beta